VRAALLVVLLLALSAPGPVPAATPPATPEAAAQAGLDDAELEEVIALLEDEPRRQRFLAQLQALRDARAETTAREEPSLGSLLVRAVAEPLQQASGQLSAVVTRLSTLPGQLPQFRNFLASEERRAALLSVGGRLGIIVGASLLVAWLTRALLSPRKQQEAPSAEPRLARVIVSAFRELLPVVVFALVAYPLVAVLELRDATRLVAIAFANAGVAVGAALALARTVLDPRRRGHRLLPSLADHDAAYLYVWLRRLVGLPVFGYFFLESALLLGLPTDVHGSLRTVLGLYVTALLVVLILQSRRPVAAWLTRAADQDAEEPRRSSPLRRLGGLWHLFAIFYVVAIFTVGAFEEGADLGFLVRASVIMLAVVVGFRYVNDWVHRLVGLLLRIPADLRTRHPELEGRVRRYEVILRRVTTVLLGAVAAVLVLAGWGLDVGAVFASDAGRGLLARVARLAIIVGGVLLLWEAFTVFVEGMLREREQDAAVGGRGARLRTLLPLFRNTVRGILLLLLSLTVLSELGIDIGPLLAGAGVVGLAVGFGAQSLVKDVINGVFILLEDTITVGDVVTLGGHSGVVERMGIRTVRLRDLSGAVHTLPYGEVTTILNMTEDFSFALLDVGVAYRENTDEVVALLKEVAAELAEEADFRDAVQGELEVFGVNEFADSAVMVRVRQRTVAGQQWRVKRELNRRIKLRFDERGIEIPFPHRTLYFGVDKQGAAPPARLELDRRQADPDPPQAEPGPG
jgi:small conductance mechanosensitive channel